jgi:alpha-glucoside transport system substrate-binding protein
MRASQRRSLIIATTAATAFALILSGCSAGSATSTAKAGCESYSAYQGHDGTTVEINTTIVSPEAELFQQALQEFQDCTGITINWNGTKDFETQLPVRVAGGTAPDLAVFPQPGLLAAMAATGKLLPAPDAVAKSVDANYSTDWKAYGTVKGTFYAAPLGANVKSFIWYNPSVFKANGWSIPTTWDEVLSLADKISSGGKIQPFCAGFESGGATGWVGTDWVEEMVLRFEGADTYDKWISHAIPFNDPKIADALAHAGAILKNPKYIGDVPSIATTSFQVGGAGIVDGTCAMHAQASFIGGILVSNNGATIVDPSDTSNPKGISVFYEPGKTATDKPARVS